jgi:lipid A 3-O-deacylase
MRLRAGSSLRLKNGFAQDDKVAKGQTAPRSLSMVVADAGVWFNRQSAIGSTMKFSCTRTFVCCCLLLFIYAAAAAQAAPEQGGHEAQVWTGGGYAVSGGTSQTGIFDVGLRYGWILTDPHLPGVLRGRSEYAVDFEPAYLIFQPANTAYGWGFNPFGLKWNFVRRRRLSPYFELSGGTLFTNHAVPAYTNTVNFTSAAALGTHVLGPKYNWSVELRYLHISNAGLANPNPGINTVQVRLGVGKFWK